MPAKYLVVGTKTHVHSFIHRLFLRRLCIPVATTVMNAYVIARFLAPDVLRVLNDLERGVVALLLTALTGTMVHLWTYALRTLALRRAVVPVPNEIPLPPSTPKGESTCRQAQSL